MLSSFGAENPKEEAYLIIERLFGVSPALLIADRDRDFSSRELDEILEKRKNREPLQYIFGEWEFMGKEFYVSPACLIPRPDTEILVEKALDIINAKCKTAPTSWEIADFCTGSGCIGLSLLMYVKNIDRMTLVDISKDALDMAKKNAHRHGIFDKCDFVLGDIRNCMEGKKFDMIVSNPPYIPTRDIENLSLEVKKEPSLALDGGNDGLDIIRFLIGDGLNYLNEGGYMLIEFGFDQGKIMDDLLREKCDTGSIKGYEILYDYGKNPRVAVVER